MQSRNNYCFPKLTVDLNRPSQIETSGGPAYNNGLVHVALDGTVTTGSSTR